MVFKDGSKICLALIKRRMSGGERVHVYVAQRSGKEKKVGIEINMGTQHVIVLT
jgi:hypothetical protein